MCASCGWQAECAQCNARLVVHRDAGLLRCHHCGHAERIPSSCPHCGNVDLVARGFGTQRLERALGERFPAARIARIDRDSTKRRSAFGSSRSCRREIIDILVGTQMLAGVTISPASLWSGCSGADIAPTARFSRHGTSRSLLFRLPAGQARNCREKSSCKPIFGYPLYQALAANRYGNLPPIFLPSGARQDAAMRIALVAAEASSREAVDTFLRRCAARADRSHKVKPSPCSAVPRRSRGAREWAWPSARAKRTAARSALSAGMATRSKPARRSCAGRSTSIHWDSRETTTRAGAVWPSSIIHPRIKAANQLRLIRGSYAAWGRGIPQSFSE